MEQRGETLSLPISKSIQPLVERVAGQSGRRVQAAGGGFAHHRAIAAGKIGNTPRLNDQPGTIGDQSGLAKGDITLLAPGRAKADEALP